jgi:Flp pilus assembly protein CpaB
MRRGRIFFYLAFIIILALIAVFVVWQRFLQPANTTPGVVQETAVPKVDVVIVTQRVPRGAVLEANVLSTIPWQENALIPGMFQKMDQVIGRQARFDLEAGIPLTSGMLVTSAEQLSTTGSLAALSIPKGMVAVSIPIDRLSAVSYAPQSGDHVNVIVTMSFVDLDTDFQTILPNKTGLVIGPGTPQQGALPNLTAQIQGSDSLVGKAAQDATLGAPVYNQPSEPQRPRLASQTLLQDAVVLRMGDFTETPPTAAPTQTPGEAQPTAEATPTVTKPPEVVTLIVTPQDAVTLNYLMSLGGGAKITLALRASGDDSRVETEAVTLQFLLDQYNIPVPVKLPYGTQPRVDQVALPTLTSEAAATPQP